MRRRVRAGSAASAGTVAGRSCLPPGDHRPRFAAIHQIRRGDRLQHRVFAPDLATGKTRRVDRASPNAAVLAPKSQATEGRSSLSIRLASASSTPARLPTKPGRRPLRAQRLAETRDCPLRNVARPADALRLGYWHDAFFFPTDTDVLALKLLPLCSITGDGILSERRVSAMHTEGYFPYHKKFCL